MITAGDTERASPLPILVLGVGNTLCGDEGIGIHVIRRLHEGSIPVNVEVVDGGSGGIELLSVMAGRDRILIVDAFEADAPAGSVLHVSADRLGADEGPPRSAHDQTVLGLARTARLLGMQCPLEIIGIVPESRAQLSLDLSPRLHGLLPEITSKVRAIVEEAAQGTSA